MSRKPTQKMDITGPQKAVDGELIKANSAKADEHYRNLAEIDKTYGSDLPYDRNQVIGEAKILVNQAQDALLEVGNRLIQLKEHENHGDFHAALNSIGIAPRAARKMIQISTKLSGSKRPALAALGKTKILELITEESDDLEELAEGGTLAGKTFDEIDRMTTRELKETLRKERERKRKESEVHDKLLAQKDKKLNEMAGNMARAEENQHRVPDAPSVIQSICTEAMIDAGTAIQNIEKMQDHIAQAMNADLGDHETLGMEYMAKTLVFLSINLTEHVNELVNSINSNLIGYVQTIDIEPVDPPPIDIETLPVLDDQEPLPLND